MTRGLWLPVVLMCVACGSKSGADASIDLTRDIQGDFIDRFSLADGSILEGTLDVSALTVTAFFEGPDGGLDSRTTPGTKTGTFVIRDVPQGRYSLAAASTIISTDRRTVHFGVNHLGRPQAAIANSGEGYRISAQGLTPWGADDEIQFFSWNAGIGFFSTSLRDFKDHRPDAGDTALNGSYMDFGGVNALQTAKGDVLTMTQLHSFSLDSGVTYKSASRSVSLQKTLLIAMPTLVNAVFDAPADDSVTLGLKRDQFLQFTNEFGPAATVFSNRMALSAHPGSFDFTVSDGIPDLVLADFPLDSGVTSLTVNFANAYPPPFEHVVAGGIGAEVFYEIHVPDGGASFPRSEVASISSSQTRSHAANQPLAPLISPLRNLKIDGVPLLAADQLMTSTQPVLTWDLPTLGTVARIDIDVFELSISSQSGATNRLIAGNIKLMGPATSFRFVPGVFSPNRFYALRITAVASTRIDPESPLKQPGPPAGNATVLSRLLSVQN